LQRQRLNVLTRERIPKRGRRQAIVSGRSQNPEKNSTGEKKNQNGNQQVVSTSAFYIVIVKKHGFENRSVREPERAFHHVTADHVRTQREENRRLQETFMLRNGIQEDILGLWNEWRVWLVKASDGYDREVRSFTNYWRTEHSVFQPVYALCRFRRL